MNIEDIANGSDSSDEDYVPDNNTTLPSEEESDGDVEDDLGEAESITARGRKRRKNCSSKKKAKHNDKNETYKSGATEKAEVEQKKKTGDLWADFMKDTGLKTRVERQQETSKSSDDSNTLVSNSPSTNETGSREKVVITEVYHFAGEEVKVDKEVDANSLEAKQLSKASVSQRRSVNSGLGSVLKQLGKKNKITTLEKSKLDWEQFKKDENIQDELQAYGKSKDGYLERQDFLQRADLRQFEIEKGIRDTLRTNRINNL